MRRPTPTRWTLRPHLRGRGLRRLAVAWLLAFGITGVLGAAQAQAAAREHACCRKAPVRAAAPLAPCASLLPLACCDATVLPGSAPGAPDRAVVLGFAPAPLDMPGPVALGPSSHAGPAPPRSPHRLSVVLRL